MMENVVFDQEKIHSTLIKDPYFSKILELHLSIKTSSSPRESHLRLANIYLQIKNPLLALVHLKIAHKWREDYRSLLLLARCYRDLGDPIYMQC